MKMRTDFKNFLITVYTRFSYGICIIWVCRWFWIRVVFIVGSIKQMPLVILNIELWGEHIAFDMVNSWQKYQISMVTNGVFLFFCSVQFTVYPDGIWISYVYFNCFGYFKNGLLWQHGILDNMVWPDTDQILNFHALMIFFTFEKNLSSCQINGRTAQINWNATWKFFALEKIHSSCVLFQKCKWMKRESNK